MAYNSAYTGSQVDAAVGAVRQKETIWDGKQDELTGTEDQIVGFNSAGEAVAVAAPNPLPDGGTAGQVLTKTEDGEEWQDPPDGLPEGGTEGQVLTKTPTGAQWDDVPSDLPAGGTDGQILTKTADGVAWEDAPEAGVTSFKGRTGAVTPQEGDYTADMVGARPDTWTPSAADVGAVPTSRTVNGQELSQDINLTADNVGARPSTWTPSAEDVGAVPTSRTVNGKALSENISLTADDVGARPNTWTPTASDVGAVPTSRTVNGKALSSNITLTADDVNAASPPSFTTITLPASGWSDSTQTVTVSGVLADETAQLIQPMPAMASQTAYYEAGILCTGQAANQLTFTCQNVPTEDLTVYVVMQEVGA